MTERYYTIQCSEFDYTQEIYDVNDDALMKSRNNSINYVK